MTETHDLRISVLRAGASRLCLSHVVGVTAASRTHLQVLASMDLLSKTFALDIT
jgi:hypothetical protein